MVATTTMTRKNVYSTQTAMAKDASTKRKRGRVRKSDRSKRSPNKKQKRFVPAAAAPVSTNTIASEETLARLYTDGEKQLARLIPALWQQGTDLATFVLRCRIDKLPRHTKNPVPKPPSRPIPVLNPLDIVFGRGNKNVNRSGNWLFRQIIVTNQATYKNCYKEHKSHLALHLVGIFRRIGTRFLEPSKTDPDQFNEVTDTGRIVEKFCQALREQKTINHLAPQIHNILFPQSPLKIPLCRPPKTERQVTKQFRKTPGVDEKATKSPKEEQQSVNQTGEKSTTTLTRKVEQFKPKQSTSQSAEPQTENCANKRKRHRVVAMDEDEETFWKNSVQTSLSCMRDTEKHIRSNHSSLNVRFPPDERVEDLARILRPQNLHHRKFMPLPLFSGETH